jgi:predicted DNA-binding transcriptional regulator AlpA
MTTETTPAPPAHLVLLRLPQVGVRTGLSRSERYRLITLAAFPTPIKIGELAGARSLVQIGCSMGQDLAGNMGGPTHGA